MILPSINAHVFRWISQLAMIPRGFCWVVHRSTYMSHQNSTINPHFCWLSHNSCCLEIPLLGWSPHDCCSIFCWACRHHVWGWNHITHNSKLQKSLGWTPKSTITFWCQKSPFFFPKSATISSISSSLKPGQISKTSSYLSVKITITIYFFFPSMAQKKEVTNQGPLPGNQGPLPGASSWPAASEASAPSGPNTWAPSSCCCWAGAQAAPCSGAWRRCDVVARAPHRVMFMVISEGFKHPCPLKIHFIELISIFLRVIYNDLTGDLDGT